MLKRSDDDWYLIHPDVARSGQLSGLWKAALNKGVKANGAGFVLPLTDAHAGWEERTESLREAIAGARHGWVMLESDAEQDSWITSPQTSKNSSRWSLNGSMASSPG